MLYIYWSCGVFHTGTVHAHTRTTGFPVQVKGLIRDERQPHIAPCKGPLSPFLLQCSVKLWETNDLRATALCASGKEKEGGREAVLWEGQRPRCPVFQCCPHGAIPVRSMGVFLRPPSLAAAAWTAAKLESELREQGILLQQHKGFSHLAVSWSFMVEGVLQTFCFSFVPLHIGTKKSCFTCKTGRQESNNRESNKN